MYIIACRAHFCHLLGPLARWVTPQGEPVGVLGPWTGAQCGQTPSPPAIPPMPPKPPTGPNAPLRPYTPCHPPDIPNAPTPSTSSPIPPNTPYTSAGPSACTLPSSHPMHLWHALQPLPASWHPLHILKAIWNMFSPHLDMQVKI